MKNLTARLIISFGLVATLAACGEVEDTRPGQPVKTRQVAFKEIIKVFEPMGVMLRENRYNADEFEALAIKLVEKRDGPWSHFGPDTHYPPSKSTPEVWAQPEKFKEQQDRFVEVTNALLIAAKKKEQKPAEGAYAAVHESCKSCHKQFKTR
jgi:cytochrome c556